MFVARIGSLNALEQLNKSAVWRALSGECAPSADTNGRVVAAIESDSIRRILHSAYSKLKRNKALEVPSHGLVALVLDGHESHASYKYSCEGCSTRETGDDKKLQYYHRNVTAQLVFNNLSILIDAEDIQPGEGELTAAKRLFTRVVTSYPRAFEVVLADALYCNAPFINLVLDSGKHIITPLKDNCKAVLEESSKIFDDAPVNIVLTEKNVTRVCRETDSVSLEQVPSVIRIVQSVESDSRKPADAAPANWMWVTSLPKIKANTKVIVQLGHSRWNIENQGFNETSTRWYSDHVYKHHPNAILNFWLMCMLAHNTFMCFYSRRLNPVVRFAHSKLHISKMIQSVLYAEVAKTKPP